MCVEWPGDPANGGSAWDQSQYVIHCNAHMTVTKICVCVSLNKLLNKYIMVMELLGFFVGFLIYFSQDSGVYYLLLLLLLFICLFIYIILLLFGGNSSLNR